MEFKDIMKYPIDSVCRTELTIGKDRIDYTTWRVCGWMYDGNDWHVMTKDSNGYQVISENDLLDSEIVFYEK